MNYPLISEYIEAIKSAEDNFKELTNLRPVLDDDGQHIMTSGNFAVVFKMKDIETGKLHALKCFTKEQEGRAEAYRHISEELEYVSSTFLTPIKYLDKELFVDSSNSDESEFPVLLMDWIEGKTLDKYIREHVDDEFELSLLAYQFSRLAMWLMPQPFAHGDLKPDNILVKEDGTLVLVDYDGMYVPAMKGQKARELGSPDFRHPNRTEKDFDEHIDDFSFVCILVSLKAIAWKPSLLEEYGASDRLLFSQDDYRDICKCRLLKELYPSEDPELNILFSLFIIAQTKGNLVDVPSHLFDLPKTSELIDEIGEAMYKAWEEERAPYNVKDSWSLDSFIKEFKIISFQQGYPYYSVTDGGEDGFFFKSKSGKIITVFNQSELTKENLLTQRDSIIVELRKSGHYILCGYGTKASDYDLRYARKDEDGVMYSKNHIKLIGVYGSYLPEYEIAEGTVVICDDALNGFWSEIEGLMISGKITIPSSVRFIGRNPFRGDYDTIICKSPHFVVENDALYTSNKKRLISCFCKDPEFVIPEGVEQIGSFAFYDCNIARVVIPESVSYIGDNPFISTNYLSQTQIEVVSQSRFLKVIDNSLYDVKNKKLISFYGKDKHLSVLEGTRIINDYAFGYTALECLALPKSIETIGHDIFLYGWDNLKTILIPHGSMRKFEVLLPEHKDKLVEQDDPEELCTKVKDEDLANAWIDEYGVKYSTDRKRLLDGSEITEHYSVRNGTIIICNNAFSSCKKMHSITIPDSVTRIGLGAFSGCSGLTSINIPSSVTRIDNYIFFECSGLKSINIPENVTSIGLGAFFGCRNLSSIYIPDCLMNIGNEAFSGCSSLNSILVSEDNRYFDSRKKCNAIIETATNILKVGCMNTILPDSITCIGNNAFSGCSGLTSITIPDSVTSVGNNAFSGCSGLTSITIPDSVTSICDGVFDGCNRIESIFISKGNKTRFVQMMPKYRDKIIDQNDLENMSKKVTDEDLANAWTDEYGVKYSADRKRLLKGSVTIEEYSVRNGTKTICEKAFESCKKMHSISIPNSVMTIGDSAFCGCWRLITITIPNKVTKIGDRTFLGCCDLSSINIPDNVESIGYGAFLGCRGLTSINIPDSVKSIGYCAFEGCRGLTSITIPDSVTSIGSRAFEGCSGLTSIIIPKGTQKKLGQMMPYHKNIFVEKDDIPY